MNASGYEVGTRRDGGNDGGENEHAVRHSERDEAQAHPGRGAIISDPVLCDLSNSGIEYCVVLTSLTLNNGQFEGGRPLDWTHDMSLGLRFREAGRGRRGHSVFPPRVHQLHGVHALELDLSHQRHSLSSSLVGGSAIYLVTRGNSLVMGCRVERAT